jgi:hypothetical protein
MMAAAWWAPALAWAIPTTLGWRPFLDPLDAHGLWALFLLPLAVLIAIVYRAVRHQGPAGGAAYWREVVVMTLLTVVAMILLGAAAFVFVEYLLPLLAPMPS